MESQEKTKGQKVKFEELLAFRGIKACHSCCSLRVHGHGTTVQHSDSGSYPWIEAVSQSMQPSKIEKV